MRERPVSRPPRLRSRCDDSWAAVVQASECYRSIGVASSISGRPSRGTDRDRRPRHLRGRRPGLHVTPSAISSGSALESSIGRFVVQRRPPAADRGRAPLLPSPARRTAPVRRGAGELADDGHTRTVSRSPSTRTPSRPRSVTWWTGSAARTTWRLRLHVEDQAWSATCCAAGRRWPRHLRRGHRPGLLDRAPRRAPLPPAATPTAPSADGSARLRRKRMPVVVFQREGRPPARPAARRAGSNIHPHAASGPDLRRLPQAVPARPGLGVLAAPQLEPDLGVRTARCCSARVGASTSTSTGSSSGWTRPCWPASPMRYAAPPLPTSARSR